MRGLWGQFFNNFFHLESKSVQLINIQFKLLLLLAGRNPAEFCQTRKERARVLSAHELSIKEQKYLIFILWYNTPARSANGLNGCIQNMSQSSKMRVLQPSSPLNVSHPAEEEWLCNGLVPCTGILCRRPVNCTKPTWVIVLNTRGLSFLIFHVNSYPEKGLVVLI